MKKLTRTCAMKQWVSNSSEGNFLQAASNTLPIAASVIAQKGFKFRVKFMKTR